MSGSERRGKIKGEKVSGIERRREERRESGRRGGKIRKCKEIRRCEGQCEDFKYAKGKIDIKRGTERDKKRDAQSVRVCESKRERVR